MRAPAFLGTWGVLLLANTTWAAPVFIGTHGSRLYRTDGGVVQTFTLGDDITAMATAADGTIWATSRSDDDGDGFCELYTLADPLGPAPSLVLQGDFLEDLTPTITFIDGTLYGFQRDANGSLIDGVLVTIDAGTQTQAVVGQTGVVGTAFAGSGYDPATDTLFMSAGRPLDAVYEADYALANGPDPTGTMLGQIDVNFENHGAEFFEGTYYALVQYQGGPLTLGSIDLATQEFTEIQVIGPTTNRAIGLAIIPEPSTLAILTCGAWTFWPRRRR